ncbi:MAG: TilS substrate-binding domain-containing protein [Anaerosacchariphilus sp.]
MNVKAARHVAEAAAELGEVEQYLERKTDAAYRLAVREEDDARFVFANAFSREETLIGGRVLRRCMAELGGLKDVERVHIEQIRELMEKQTGSRIDLPNGRSARREYEGVRISRGGICAAAGQPCIDLPGDSGQRPDSGADGNLPC